jgi:hypothetical protein
MAHDPIPGKTSPALLLNAVMSHAGERANNDSAAVSF